MASANFKQYDSRWGQKNYNGSSNMATAGCGPTSVANIAYNIDASITPWKVAQWMQKNGYAIRNNGTAWAGIPAAMKHYGFTDVRNVEKMADVFSYISKGYKAIFLMKAGTRGGVTWTTAGHFIAVTAYKHSGGKHYFWTRDSGGRNNNGWHCYETQMKGLIPQVWVGKVPEAKATTKAVATKAAVKKTKAQKITERAKADAWAYGTKKSKYAYPKGKRRSQYVKDLKSAYGSRKGWGKQTKAGASCDVFVGTVVRACGVDKKFPRGLSEQVPYLKKSSKWKKVSRKKSNLKKGDIIYQRYNSGGQHIMIYLGGNKVANAHYKKKTYPIIEKYSSIVKSASKCKSFIVYRAK